MKLLGQRQKTLLFTAQQYDHQVCDGSWSSSPKGSNAAGPTKLPGLTVGCVIGQEHQAWESWCFIANSQPALCPKGPQGSLLQTQH
jgi:hypothetical protein